jgi:alpha-beta hydrolase superfamily lysophospholipase
MSTYQILLWLFVFLVMGSHGALAESTPTSFQSVTIDEQIVSVVDGPLSDALHLPLRQFYPKNRAPVGIVLAVHGLTLHGGLYDVVGKVLAVDGFHFCAPDMRGFGRCYYDDKHKYCVGNDCKNEVDYEKTFDDLVELMKKLRQEHPGVPLFLMGESLGTAVCIRLAAEHPEMVSGLILSGPTVKVHPLMFLHPEVIAAGTVGYMTSPRFQVSMDAFVKNLISNDPDVVEEILADPLCRKSLTIKELLATKRIVNRTLHFARMIKPHESVLIVQGSEDKCLIPKAVTRLTRRVRSDDQTLRWLHAHGHLLLETAFLRPATVNSVYAWLVQQGEGKIEYCVTTLDMLRRLGNKLDDGQ